MLPGDRLMAALVEPVKKGYKFNEWPPHVTVIPWFRLGLSSSQIATELTRRFKNIRPFVVTMADEVQLSKKIANLVEMPSEFMKIEKTVRVYLRQNKAWLVDETTKLKRSYVPHITVQSTARLQAGDEFICTNLYLISQQGSYKQVEEVIQLSQPAKIIQSTKPYVSRAGLKLATVADKLKLDFQNKVVLDVGSSTGGFTDYALQHGAKKVIAVDLGTMQLHLKLRGDKRIEIHEQTDIRNFKTNDTADLVLIDVSFISLRLILPAVRKLLGKNTVVVAMVKPQFETSQNELKNRGVIKNERVRRQIFKDFEFWVQKLFKVVNKADSQVAGEKGNLERFYLLQPLNNNKSK